MGKFAYTKEYMQQYPTSEATTKMESCPKTINHFENEP